jgi:hypothetical protein
VEAAMMTIRVLLACWAVVFGLVLAGCGSGVAAGPTGAAGNGGNGVGGGGGAAGAGGYKVSGPYSHDNLTIFLIHGADKIKGKTYLTLQEAMAQGKVVVNETGNVNELTIENISTDDVYLQSGDIVKGGRQDRTVQNDLVLQGKSGKVPLQAFCVESGRWSGRQGEASGAFGSSNNALASKQLKVAAKGAGDQGAVWQEVSKNQGALARNAGGSVADPRSASSMQLTLENKKVQEATESYQKELTQIVQGKTDVIGYAFAINGKLNSVDIYASNALFNKMWDKNLNAACTEAFANYSKDAKFDTMKPEVVTAALADAASGKAVAKDLNPRVKLVSRESKDNWQFETYDNQAAQPAHINVITRDPESEKLMQNRPGQSGSSLQGTQQFDPGIAPNPAPNPAPNQPSR